MCGIYCCISRKGHARLSPETKALLEHRGPDSLKQHDVECNGLFLSFTSSVLSLRGTGIVAQPLIDNISGSVLCWNGEAWSIAGEKIKGNDSLAVFDQLVKALKDDENCHRAVLKVFSDIRGPFACVFYDAVHHKLYYGRDCLGRRSLVTSTNADGDVVISSLSHSGSSVWTEVDADGMYVISLEQTVGTSSDSALFKPSHINATYETDSIRECILIPYPRLNVNLPCDDVEQLTLNSPAVLHLESLLNDSMKLRLNNLPGAPETPLGILFSGGLDSALLAYYAHLNLPDTTPIDLLNVAFQNPRIHSPHDEDPYSSCPDRITGLSAYKALCIGCPTRLFRFICVNVPFTETMAHRETIMTLMEPHKTEMDLSISSALYFAARGIGKLYGDIQEGTSAIYNSATRILLSGLGADELFAGYNRHAIAFDRHGYTALLAELDLDAGRLGKRNLGRDDRVTSHWAREVRYPFLDENVVAWALAAPVWEKCGFRTKGERSCSDVSPALDREKLILRLLAWKHGLHSIAREKKRAIQFGSRTAKMHSGKSKGTDKIK